MPEAIAAPPPTPAPSTKPSAAAPAIKPAAASPIPAADKPSDIKPPTDQNDDGLHDVLGSDFDELQELDGKAPKDKPKKVVPKADDKTEPADKSKANGHKELVADKEPETNKELRDTYHALKEKVAKEYEPKLKRLPELEAKVKELESRDESTTKATQDEIAAVKKRNGELEQHIRFIDFEKSSEYQDQFQKPYERAWSDALRELKGLTFAVEDPKTGEEVRREVTQADIAYFANLDPAARRTEINRLFPDDKEEVKRHINQISSLAEKSFAAKEKAKADAETHAKTQTEAQRQSQNQRAKLWKQTNEALATKYPKWFGKDEADPEGNSVFEKGAALSDLLFSPADLTPDRVELLPQAFKDAIASAKPFPPELMAKLHAIVRNKAANHDRAVTQLKAARTRISELEKSLKEYDDSGPDKIIAGKRRITSDEPMSDEEELHALTGDEN